MRDDMAPFLIQLRGLLWRNFVIKTRQWLHLALEVLTPIFLVGVMILISLGTRPQTTPAVPFFPAHNFSFRSFPPPSAKPIFAAPNLQFTHNVMDSVSRLLNVTSRPVQFRQELTSAESNEIYRKKPSVADVAVEFLWKNKSQGISVEGYVLRVPYEVVSDVALGCFARGNTGLCGRQKDGLSTECPGNQPLTSGLLGLQWAVETALIQTFKDPGFEPPALQIQMMPVPYYRPGATNAQLLISISMVIALAPLAYFVTVTMVTERKTGAKVIFKVMGIRESVFWLSWWITYTVAVVLVSVTVTVLLALAGFLASAGLGLVFVLLVLYGSSLLTLSFLMSVCFSSPKVGGLVSSVLTVLLGLLYLAVSLTRPSTPLSLPSSPSPVSMTQSAVPFPLQVVLSVFSPVALALGLDQAVFDHEENLKSHIVSGQFPLLAAVVMLLFDTVLYGCLAVYLHIVVPNQYRLPRKPWFCCMPSYWRGRRGDDKDSEDVIPCDIPEGPHIEPMSEAQTEVRAIRIRDISKKFGNGKNEPVYGLNGLDLDIYEGQVTCVLGHPGAGKTTLLNILAGIMQPISGVAYVYDLNACNIHDHKELVKTVSYCPQNDVIPDDVTVEEHVRMTAFLAGMKVEGLNDMITNCLHGLQLYKDRKLRARDLTASQRRRLSLAAALLVDTKVVLLDEPTLGLEGEERRHLWELLHARKDMRVIICTTRHMEDTHYFADRTVVLSRGRLRCVGTPQFLKKQFNVGYQLNVTVKAGSSSDRLLRAVKTHIRGATLCRSEGTKITITLPLAYAARLSGLLKVLESKDRGAEYLGVTEIGLTMTTLEQLFWKMADDEEAGHVFISPLLTPADDSLSSYGDDISRRSSVFPTPESPRAVTPQLDDLSRRFSVFPAAKQIGLNVNDDANTRRKSAFPRIQVYVDSSHCDDNKDGRSSPGGGITRRLSAIFSKATPQSKRRQSSLDSATSAQSTTPTVSRRATLFADALLKRHKDGSRSPSLANMRKSHTSNVLPSMADSQNNVEESSSFSGAILPTSLAERRATVAAFQDFRRSISMQSNLSGLGSLSEQPTSPPDPMARLSVFDTYDRSARTSLNSSFRSTRHSTSSSLEEISNSHADGSIRDPESGPTHPAKIGEVLANMKPLKTGYRLQLQRLRAMLRLRLWLSGKARCWVLFRILLPVLIAGVGVGLARATQRFNPTSTQPGDRIRLFNIAHLTYRNLTDGSIEDLEADFSLALGDPERKTLLTSDAWNSPLPLESVLDVLQANGSAYRLFYNSSCALALPHVTSFLAHLMRNISTPTPVNPHNQAYLEPQLSAWLQAWPPRSPLRSNRPWDWVPVLFLGMALILTPVHSAARLVRERKDKLRSYLGVAGVNRLTYYASSFIIDVIGLAISAGLIIIICAVSQIPMLKGAMASVALLLKLTVPVAILTAYLASFCFTCPSTCRVLLLLVLLLVTVSQFCLVHFLDVEESENVSTVLHYVFSVLWPPYLPCGALHYIARTGDQGQTSGHIFRSKSHINVCYIMLLVDIIVLSCLVLLLDKLTFRPPKLSCCGCNRKKCSLIDHSHSDDKGVVSELQSVQELHKSRNKDSWPRLVLQSVSKVVRGTTASGCPRCVSAVNNVTLAVGSGQLLALLGPRGAGKTTLMDLVLGLNPATEGSIHMEGEKLGSCQWTEWVRQMGYCPQYNPLWAPLTVDQHMQFVANLTGMQQDDLHSFRESLYYDLDLAMYRAQKITQLSDCEKRKLCFAMSMLGQQTAMILDEPSTGMEPRSRRLYWDAMKHFLESSDRSGVVSTHSVEEAKALCSRLALVVNGRIRHMGTADELEQRCRQTYTLEVRFRDWDEGGSQQSMDMLRLFLTELFPTLTLVEHFHTRALFLVQCSSPDFSLASTFDTLESIKRNLDLDEFTFSQCSLDQLFLDMSRHQKYGDGKFITLDDLHTKPTPDYHPAPHINSTTPSAEPPTEPPVAVSSKDLHQPSFRDMKAEGGASRQDDVSDADAAVGMVVIHHSGDDDGGGVACGEEGGESPGVGAAAPVKFSLDGGEDNPAFVPDEDKPPEVQTAL